MMKKKYILYTVIYKFIRVYHYINIISFKCWCIYIIHKSLNEFGKGRAFTDVLDSLKTFSRSSCFSWQGFVQGSVGAAIGGACAHPLDLIKVPNTKKCPHSPKAWINLTLW